MGKAAQKKAQPKIDLPYIQTVSLKLDEKRDCLLWEFRIKWWLPVYWLMVIRGIMGSTFGVQTKIIPNATATLKPKSQEGTPS